jgi:hypothetical protein
MRKEIVLTGLLCLGACTTTQQETAVRDGQLFCAVSTATGPLVVALADAAGVPVTVTNKTSSVVAASCAVIGAIPVSPPAHPSTAPVVAASVS